MANKSRTVAFLGLCTALAMILAYIEAVLPPIFSAVPGIKMGLPNIIIIFLLYRKMQKKCNFVTVPGKPHKYWVFAVTEMVTEDF